jgi:hypothetical protein
MFQDHWALISSTTGETELYDVQQDPRETRNLYTPEDRVAQRMGGLLQDWLKMIPRKGSPVKLDRHTMDRLRSLGYMQ